MLEWYVYIEDSNAKNIREYNIFRHRRFLEDCIKNAKKNMDNKDVFVETLYNDLLYYFFCKSEWEIILSPWLSGRDGFLEKKVSVFDQISQHWVVFSNFVWENRKQLAKSRRNSASREGVQQ